MLVGREVPMCKIHEDAKAIVQKVCRARCQNCGSTGSFQLEDTITEKRTWALSVLGVSKIEKAFQTEATPYLITCRDCGAELREITSDELDTLAESKDTL